MDRLVAQYFQSRSEMRDRRYDTDEATDDDARYGLTEWVRQHSAPAPRRGNDGKSALWFELDNAQVKALSAYDGPECDSSASDCLGGVDEGALARAKASLSNDFDLVHVVEYLSSELSVAYLGDTLCFDFDRATGRVNCSVAPSYSKLGDAPKPVPDLRKARYVLRGKVSKYRRGRRGNATWWASHDTQRVLRDLERRNEYDVRLFDYATNAVRRRLQAHWADRGYPAPAPPLPPAPCSGAPGATCWDGRRGHFPADDAIAG